MNKASLYNQIKKKSSFLCLGLDTDIDKIPSHLKNEPDPIFSFNKAIIDATHDLCVAYKLNTAFYESQGVRGWEAMQKTLDYIPKDIFTIADAKRGDIGNTSKMYASAFFENMDFDSVTVAPYMGQDSVKPFLDFKDHWVILLALTSNIGAMDFQNTIQQGDEIPLFEKVIMKSQEWGDDENMMFVVGATRGEMFKDIRNIAPHHFLLVPGVGAQGGDLKTVCKHGLNDQCGLLVNSSRGIIYASNGIDFAQQARKAAKAITDEMKEILDNI